MTATADTTPLPLDSQPLTASPKPDTPALKSPDRLILLPLLLGFAIDFLFYEKPLGVSFPIFIGLGAILLLFVAVAERAWPSWKSIWLAVPMLGFAIMVFVRAEPLTTFVNVCLALALGLLWVRTFKGGELFRFGLIDYFVTTLLGGLETIGRPLPVLATSGRDTMSASGRRRLLLPVVRGLLLVTPVLCVFSVLLSSADLVFADRLRDVLETLNLDNIPELVLRAFLIGMAAFAAIGLLMQAIVPMRYALIGEDGKLLPHVLGSIETTIVLGGINLLFAAFVIIQFRYLFGGTANISEAGYTYSEYARRGFGELTAVVFLTLLVLLALSSVARLESARTKSTYSALNVLTVALVGVMVVSALQRLLLYEEIYGFTRLRTYSHVAIIWLGALFVPYLMALLAGRLRWFAPGALFVVIGFAATLNGLNVDRFIAARNIDRFNRGLEFLGYQTEDASAMGLHTYYLLTLSDDALPDLLMLYARDDAAINAVLGPGLACRAEQIVGDYGSVEWQSTHLSHQAALESLRSLLPDLASYRIIHHPYGNYVYINGERVTCYDLLQSYVLEPGLTREYR